MPSSSQTPEPPEVSPDPDDDYLIALARVAGADYLISGDRHLLDLTDPDPPVLTPRQFLDLLETMR
jgi:predicted nucleic acid-binding protein